MHASAPTGLAIAAAKNDADLEAMVTVRTAADPDAPAPRIQNLRHNLSAQKDLVYLVARLDDEPVACGFVYPDIPQTYAEAHLVVVPRARRRGVGSAMLAAVGAAARRSGKESLQGEVREDDGASRSYLERRGYSIVGGEQAVALDLASLESPATSLPEGIRIVSLAERPDLVDALYPVGAEAAEDIPGTAGRPTYEQWRAVDIDRPTRDPKLFFIALAGEEPVGYAMLDDHGRDAFHGLTAVARAWRRRGVATALKQTQIAVAKQTGYRRLVTASEDRNLPMRSLNAKLGFVPEPSLSTVVLRGPADVRWPHGDD